MSNRTYTIEPFLPSRQVVADIVQLASRKHMIQGLIEVDVTRARKHLRDIKEKTGESL